ncbi:glycosyltransferase family 2 protein [Candidatus Pelagibacter bacterium]|nr:glycosyltransferase family 2 protein [Candidatus Pelagibacter bacterium]
MEKFSVIIRNRNEEAWIGHCIQSIIENFEDPEIIIIDNNSKDKSLEIAKTFKKNKNFKDKKNNNYAEIKIFNINDYTPGKSLNYGVSKCKNKNIMIISAHCVINKINIDDVIKNLKKYKAIFGKQDPVMRGKKISKRYIWSHFVNEKIENMFSNQENRFFFHNAASIFKKSTLKKIPFDEELSGKEDRFWIKEIVKSKFKYLYDPSFSVYHHYTSNGATWKGLS